MSQSRKEELFTILFEVLGELTEHESPDVIFDRIVEDFALSAEYHMGQADTFKSMLDTFRHVNPADIIPESFSTPDLTEESVLSTVSDIDREYLLQDRDNLLDFIRNVNFPQNT